MLHLKDKSLQVHLVDIALKGALVHADKPHGLSLAEPCRLILSLVDGDDSIVMQGKVAHLADQHVGIECMDIDVVSLTRLRRLIELNTADIDLADRELARLFSGR